MTNTFFIIIAALLASPVVMAASKITGMVHDENNQPVAGATVYWQETSNGTATDADGRFALEQKDGERLLVISYIGYTTVTMRVEEGSGNAGTLHITMKGAVELEEVVVSERSAGLISSRTDVFQTQKITYAELCRAACCNLAESFETNPSVDVSYSDAATGARQIRLLGLAGTYVQMLTENYPNFRGASSPYGLDYTPGPWMESIQVSKGTSSVKNGYEALAGQINVEYKKPVTADPLTVNLFASDAGRYEGNSDAAFRVGDKLSTGLFVHYSSDGQHHDDNGDGFLDIPLKKQVNVMNRWQHRVGNYVAQYGVRYLNDDRTGGQSAKHNSMAGMTNLYRIGVRANRVEGYTKQAYILNPDKVESVALIASGSYHDQQSHYAGELYNVYQKNLYASLMYEKAITPLHSISAGLSLNHDGFDENYTHSTASPDEHDAVSNFTADPSLQVRNVYNRSETVPGAYAQYTFNLNDKLVLLGGVRADRSSLYGLFVTPRIHARYNPVGWLNLRASAGKGYRTANVLTENSFVLAGSRRLWLEDNLDQEEAWNTGINTSFYIPLGGKDLILNLEWYYTNFLRQVVVDMDSDPHAVRFYNLDGKSYASSIQLEATYAFPFLRGVTLTGAWRYTDAQTDYRDPAGETTRRKRPLAGDYKGLLTASYQTPLKKWQFDLTGQFNGGGRMPLPDAAAPLWESNYKPWQMWNAQVTKFFRQWSVYLGAENIAGFTQSNPVISAANPYSAHFDASMIWGPLHGRTIYAGIRLNIPPK